MFAQLIILLIPIDISEAFDPALSGACSSKFVLLVDRGFNHILDKLPRTEFTPLLCTALLALSEEQ